MNYFKSKNNEIFAYDDEQIEKVNKYNNAISNVGLDYVDDTVTYKENFPSWVVDLSNKIDNLTPITESELAELQKPTQAELDAQKVSEAKSYLASTDWIVTKIAELQLEGVDVEPLKTKYADELAERKLMRKVV